MNPIPNILTLRLFLCTLLPFIVSGGQALGQSCCTLSGFQFSRTVTIDNTGGPAYNNIQTLFVFDSQTPIGQGK